METVTNVPSKTKQSCESTHVSLHLLLQWQSLRLSFIHAARILIQHLVLAFKEALAGLAAISKATSNTRVYLGLWIMLVVAPLAAIGYQLFPNDKASMDFTWYHVNYFHLFLILCPHISLLFVLTGVFLIMPDTKRIYFLVIPAGYHAAKIIWLIQVSSNEEFYKIVPSSFLIIGVLLSCVWFLTFDWLMTLHFHKKEGTNDRIYGLIDLNEHGELSDDVAMALIRKERKALIEFNKN